MSKYQHLDYLVTKYNTYLNQLSPFITYNNVNLQLNACDSLMKLGGIIENYGVETPKMPWLNMSIKDWKQRVFEADLSRTKDIIVLYPTKSMISYKLQLRGRPEIKTDKDNVIQFKR